MGMVVQQGYKVSGIFTLHQNVLHMVVNAQNGVLHLFMLHARHGRIYLNINVLVMLHLM